jgi:hypothetical protein
MKTARATVISLGAMLAPTLFATIPCSTATLKPCSLPEPSAIPELVLCLTVTGIGFLLWRRNRKSA